MTARRDIKFGSFGFTLLELLVVVAIIAVLIAILLPALHLASDHANKIRCMSNVHQIVVGMVAYSATCKGWLPGPNGMISPTGNAQLTSTDPLVNGTYGYNRPIESGWLYKLGFIKSPQVWICPQDGAFRRQGSINIRADDFKFSYTFNTRLLINKYYDSEVSSALPGWGSAQASTVHPITPGWQRKMASFRHPSEVPVIGEENSGYYTPTTTYINDPLFSDSPDRTEGRHLSYRRFSKSTTFNGISVVGFLDGHADICRPGIGFYKNGKTTDNMYWPAELLMK